MYQSLDEEPIRYYNMNMILSDKIFLNAIIASVIFHLFLFIGWHPLKNSSMQKDQKPTEFTYQAVRKAPIDSKLIAEKTIKRPLQQKSPEIAKAETLQKGDLAKPVSATSLHEKIPLRSGDIEKKVVDSHISMDEPMLISHEKKDLTSEPTYLDYYNAIRSSIYKTANADKPYYFMEGDVRLVFKLARDGRMLYADIIQQGSSNNPILQKHALMSLRRASPFPSFHEDMSEDQLTLRITISFEK